MKTSAAVLYAGLSLVLLSLSASCSHAPVNVTTKPASADEMNLLRSLGSKTPAAMHGTASGSSADDVGTASPPVSVATDLPDLFVRSLSAFPAFPRKVESGDSFTLVTKVKNRGTAQTNAESAEQYYLSRNRSYNPKDKLLIGRRIIPILQPNQFSKGSATVSVPPSVPSGWYYVISCADDLKNITEKNELNNCRASESTIRVVQTSAPIAVTLNENLQVLQGTSTDVSFPVDLAGPANYKNLSLNLQDILSTSVTITPGIAAQGLPAPADVSINAYMYIRIGAFAATVCQDGLSYGPYAVTGSTAAPTVDPPSAAAEPSSVNIINAGLFAMCIQIVSDTDASIHVGSMSVDGTECGKPPADMSGTWTGTYTCRNFGWTDDIDQPITLTITQDGNRAQYIDDGGATYDGTVCGNVFTFSRTYPLFYDTERGTFIMNAKGTRGTKTSTWRSIFSPDTNWGNCTDNLQRM